MYTNYTDTLMICQTSKVENIVTYNRVQIKKLINKVSKKFQSYYFINHFLNYLMFVALYTVRF